MTGIGIVMLILGIIGRIFASVTHITDSTVKAMGWIALNKIVGILSWFLIVGGIVFIIAGLGGAEI